MALTRDQQYAALAPACDYYSGQDVRWPELRGGRRRKGLKNRPPEGRTVEIVFRDWRRGDLDEVFWQIVETEKDPELLGWYVCCRNCARKDECHGVKLEENLLVCALGREFSFVWQLSKRLRRALVILLVFGEEGQRHGGYFGTDLKKMFGLEDIESTLRLLVKWGFLRDTRANGASKGRRARYVFSHWSGSSMPYIEDVEHILRNSVALRRNSKVSIDPERFSMAPGVYAIGEPPPAWFIEIISDSMKDADHKIQERFGELSYRERKDWIAFREAIKRRPNSRPVFVMPFYGTRPEWVVNDEAFEKRFHPTPERSTAEDFERRITKIESACRILPIQPCISEGVEPSQ